MHCAEEHFEGCHDTWCESERRPDGGLSIVKVSHRQGFLILYITVVDIRRLSRLVLLGLPSYRLLDQPVDCPRPASRES